MNLFIDPISATVASWQMVGKTIEQQLRIGTAINQALMAPFKVMAVPVAKKPGPDFTSKRVVSAPKAKVKTAPRKASAKPKNMKSVAAAKVTTLESKSNVEPLPIKPASAPKVTPKTAKLAKSGPKPVASKAPDPKSPSKTAVAAPKPVEAKVPKPRRKTRAPSTPPAMPSAAKDKPKA